MIEAVIFTYTNDFSLARVLLRSLKLYCPSVKKTHVLIDEKFLSQWKTFEINDVVLHTKESVWPSEIPYPNNGYQAQKILKLLSYLFTQSEYIWILDADMLLTKPMNEK